MRRSLSWWFPVLHYNSKTKRHSSTSVTSYVVFLVIKIIHDMYIHTPPSLLCWRVMWQEVTNNQSWPVEKQLGTGWPYMDWGVSTYNLCSSLRIMNEKQHFTIGWLDPELGFFREQAVKRVSCAGSKAIVPNSSQ